MLSLNVLKPCHRCFQSTFNSTLNGVFDYAIITMLFVCNDQHPQRVKSNAGQCHLRVLWYSLQTVCEACWTAVFASALGFLSDQLPYFNIYQRAKWEPTKLIF